MSECVCEGGREGEGIYLVALAHSVLKRVGVAEGKIPVRMFMCMCTCTLARYRQLHTTPSTFLAAFLCLWASPYSYEHGSYKPFRV